MASDDADEREDRRREAMDAQVSRRFNPAAVAEAMEDPAVFEQIARGDLYIQLHHMRQLAASPSFPINRRMEYAQMLAKMGKVEKPAVERDAFAGVAPIIINLPGSGQTTQISSALPGECQVKDTTSGEDDG